MAEFLNWLDVYLGTFEGIRVVVSMFCLLLIAWLAGYEWGKRDGKR